MPSRELVRVGIVGLGKMGLYHLQKFRCLPGVALVGFVEPDAERAREVDADSGLVCFSTLASLLFEVDAVVVACPTLQHASVVKAALEAGVHVLVEKPLCERSSEARDLVQLAAAKNLILQVGMVERFRLLQLLPHLEEPPLFVETERLTNRLGREPNEIDVVSDLMIHDIDLVLSYYSDDPVSVSAVGMSVLTARTDIAQVRLEFAGGGVVNLSASRASFEVVRKMRVYTPHAYYSLDFVSGSKTVTAKGSDSVRREVHHPETGDALLAQSRSFADCVALKNAPIVSGTAGLRALALVESIQEAIATRSARRKGPLGASKGGVDWGSASS
jgi:predicted dehydrogenase